MADVEAGGDGGERRKEVLGRTSLFKGGLVVCEEKYSQTCVTRAFSQDAATRKGYEGVVLFCKSFFFF